MTMKMTYYRNLIFMAAITLLSIAACQNTGRQSDTAVDLADTTTVAENDILQWQVYTNDKYHLRLRHPDDWMVIENTELPNNKVVINFFPAGQPMETAMESETHGDSGFSYLAVYPKGLDRDFPWGKHMTFGNSTIPTPDWNFPIDQEGSMLLQLEDGEVWGYFIKPDKTPESWSEEGFIFAQLTVDNFHATCKTAGNGKEKPIADCDLAAGDQLVRHGIIDTDEAYLMTNILEELQLAGINTPS